MFTFWWCLGCVSTLLFSFGGWIHAGGRPVVVGRGIIHIRTCSTNVHTCKCIRVKWGVDFGGEVSNSNTEIQRNVEKQNRFIFPDKSTDFPYILFIYFIFCLFIETWWHGVQRPDRNSSMWSWLALHLLAQRGQHSMVCGSRAFHRAAGGRKTPWLMDETNWYNMNIKDKNIYTDAKGKTGRDISEKSYFWHSFLMSHF